MSSKVVYSEYYTKEQYEKELDKILKLKCVEYALFFYHCCQYCILRNEEFISSKKYYELCDFITDNFPSIPAGLQQYVVFNDVLSYTCNLTLLQKGETFIKGKHLIENIEELTETLDERLEIDYKLEVVEELDSVN